MTFSMQEMALRLARMEKQIAALASAEDAGNMSVGPQGISFFKERSLTAEEELEWDDEEVDPHYDLVGWELGTHIDENEIQGQFDDTGWVDLPTELYGVPTDFEKPIDGGPVDPQVRRINNRLFFRGQVEYIGPGAVGHSEALWPVAFTLEEDFWPERGTIKHGTVAINPPLAHIFGQGSPDGSPFVGGKTSAIEASDRIATDDIWTDWPGSLTTYRTEYQEPGLIPDVPAPGGMEGDGHTHDHYHLILEEWLDHTHLIPGGNIQAAVLVCPPDSARATTIMLPMFPATSFGSNRQIYDLTPLTFILD